MEVDAISWAVIIWSGVWLQLFVIPFINKRERLYELFSQSGSMDAAASRIDSKAILPELSSIFERAIAQRQDARRTIEIESLLVQVSFADSLEKLSRAVANKNNITNSYESIKRLSKIIWICGASHVGLLVASVLTMFFCTATRYAIEIAIVMWTLCAIAAIADVFALFAYERKHSRLLRLLEVKHA